MALTNKPASDHFLQANRKSIVEDQQVCVGKTLIGRPRQRTVETQTRIIRHGRRPESSTSKATPSTTPSNRPTVRVVKRDFTDATTKLRMKQLRVAYALPELTSQWMAYNAYCASKQSNVEICGTPSSAKVSVYVEAQSTASAPVFASPTTVCKYARTDNSHTPYKSDTTNKSSILNKTSTDDDSILVFHLPIPIRTEWGVPVLDFNDIVLSGYGIGEGSFGTVELARFKHYPNILAVKSSKKHITHRKVAKEAATQMLLEEYGYVPRCYGVTEDRGGEFLIIMDHVEHSQTLRNYIRKHKLCVKYAHGISLQLIKGVKAMHDHQLLHNDIKENNVLVMRTSSGPQVEIIDFGLCTGFRGGYISANSKPNLQPHLAPELFIGNPTSTSSDVYSLWRLLRMISAAAHGHPSKEVMAKYNSDTLNRSLDKTLEVLQDAYDNIEK